MGGNIAVKRVTELLERFLLLARQRAFQPLAQVERAIDTLVFQHAQGIDDRPFEIGAPGDRAGVIGAALRQDGHQFGGGQQGTARQDRRRDANRIIAERQQERLRRGIGGREQGGDLPPAVIADRFQQGHDEIHQPRRIRLAGSRHRAEVANRRNGDLVIVEGFECFSDLGHGRRPPHD